MSGILSPKFMSILVVVVMAASLMYVAHTSRQAAEAMTVVNDAAAPHVDRLQAAIEEAEQSMRSGLREQNLRQR